MILVHFFNPLVLTQRLFWKNLNKIGEVNKTSQPKHPNIFGIEEVLKTDNTENFSANTKEDDSENFKKKLKDISNTDKETYGSMVNNSLEWLKLSFWL